MSAAPLMVNALAKLRDKSALDVYEMTEAMEAIMSGACSDGDIEEFLVLLREKGETVDEIGVAARVMRKHALRLSKHYPDLLDTCGTGGDAKQTINVSTLAAIVACSAGVEVGKHGNRSVSSRCGSADLLEALDVKVDLPVRAIEASIEKVGFGFFFAPKFHPATRFVMAARKKIQGKTIFNVLGPLTNPGGALHQLVGVYSEGLVMTIAEVLSGLGAQRALVVHGMDGLDEITTCDKTLVAELDKGKIKTYTVSPEDFNLKRASLGALRCATPEQSKEKALGILEGEAGPAKDIVCFNAGAALYVAGKVRSIQEGVRLAEELIETGEAYEKLEEIVEFTQNAHAYTV